MTPSTNGPSAPCQPVPAPALSTTTTAPPATPTTKPYASWATVWSASCTAAYATKRSTTNTPPGPTAGQPRLDTYEPGMSSQHGASVGGKTSALTRRLPPTPYVSIAANAQICGLWGQWGRRGMVPPLDWSPVITPSRLTRISGTLFLGCWANRQPGNDDTWCADVTQCRDEHADSAVSAGLAHHGGGRNRVKIRRCRPVALLVQVRRSLGLSCQRLRR